MSIRECDRCHAEKPDHTRCKIRTCKTGPLCWIHTKKRYGLRVKKSTIPAAGDGLYTNKDIDRGERIIPYTGEVLTRRQINERYPQNDAQYIFQQTMNRFVDARSTQAGVARYISSCTGSGMPCNARFTNRTGTVRATRDIDADSEIFVPYGAGYALPGQQQQQQPLPPVPT